MGVASAALAVSVSTPKTFFHHPVFRVPPIQLPSNVHPDTTPLFSASSRRSDISVPRCEVMRHTNGWTFGAIGSANGGTNCLGPVGPIMWRSRKSWGCHSW